VAVKAKRTDAMASPLLGRSNTLPTMTWARDAKKITYGSSPIRGVRVFG
jgi:hypothetical protein